MKEVPERDRPESDPRERLDAGGLAELIAGHREELLQRWLRLDRAVAVGSYDEEQLRDHVPAFLTALVESLRRGEVRVADHGSAEAHGRQRFSIGFDLETLIKEYGLLRACIFDLVERRHLVLQPAAQRLLLDLVADEIAVAAAMYAREQQAQQAASARELQRRVRQAELAAAIGRAITSASPLRAQLQRCTDAMVTQVDAAFARIWTLDADGEVLELQASSGRYTHLDGRHGRMRVGTHKIGLIAKERRAHVTNDLAHDPEVSDPDWAAREGMTSFAGYPLVADDRLVGVVALFAKRSLDPDATESLASIADQIAVAIDRTTAERQRDRARSDARTSQAIATTALVDVQRAHEDLLESEGRFGALADFIPQLVWVADSTGAIHWYNRRWYEYTGTTSDEMMGWGWQSVHQPELLPGIVTRFKEAIASGQPWEDLFPLRGADGRYRWSLSRAMPVRDAQGAIVRWFGTNTDVEDQRRTEAALEERIEFEQRLIGIVSHDLRNPLQAISLGAQQVLGREGHDDRTSAVLARIRASAERALRLIGDLLDLTQTRLGGGLRIAPRSTDLTEIAVHVVDEVAVAFPKRRIELVHEGGCAGRWDPDRLAQLVMNLVVNAVKYSPAGSQVRVTTRGGAHEAVLTVHNLGPPIPAAVLPHLYEPLQRGSAKPDARGRSIGLGLYIVKHIVDAHGGRIDVTSTREEGTTFTVRLPSDPG